MNNFIRKGKYNIDRKDDYMEMLQKTWLIFTIIGAIVWGLIGFFDFNLVTWIFGDSMISKIIYIIVGLCGIVNIGILFNHIED